MKKYKFTYENSGVNINAADNFVKYIANLENKKKTSINNNNIFQNFFILIKLFQK